MIKLLWNTQNQSKPNQQETNTEIARNYIWGLYHQKNSNKWIYEILNKVKFNVIQNETDLEKEDILILIDSSIEKKSDFYSKLDLVCKKMFLFHLGDESGMHDLSNIYDKFDFVWRGFCSNKYFNNDRVQCLPIGYKSGTHKKNEKIKYKWAFIGTPHKSSRHDLLFQLSDIKPAFCHKTKKFNEKIIQVDEMSKVLSSTQFVPCPNGFVHPETYRVYEALECNCIPIVENAYKYYDRLFPNNPFIKVDKWIEAKTIINDWSKEMVIKKSEDCRIWWGKYKDQLQDSIKLKICK